jgi:hypothetical protein
VKTEACTPERGEHGDLCQVMWLDGWPGGSRGGARLALEPVVEGDVDRDLRGDRTEDRTDLRLGATRSRAANGALQTRLVISNLGPLTADLPTLEVERDASDGLFDRGWEPGCAIVPMGLFNGKHQCLLPAIGPGGSRTVTYASELPRDILVRAEGDDLAPADNTVRPEDIGLAAENDVLRRSATAPAIGVRGKATLRRGITVRVSGEGRSRIAATFKVRGRTIRVARTLSLTRDIARTLTLRPSGATLRSLRRAAISGRLRAEITLRTAAGAVVAQTATIIRR